MIENRILDFLDGRLELHDEEELLHTLAVSPEQRGLLRDHLRLREMSHALASHSELVTPYATTAGLFARLAEKGFSGPVPVPISAPAVPIMPSVPVAIGANGFGFRTAYVVAGLVVAFVVGLSASFWDSGNAGGNMAIFEPRQASYAELTHRSGSNSEFAKSEISENDLERNSALNIARIQASSRARASVKQSGREADVNYSANVSVTEFASNEVSNEVSNELSNDVFNGGSTREPQRLVTQVHPEAAASSQPKIVAADLSNSRQQVPVFYHDDDAPLPNTAAFSLSVRTGAGPVPGGSMNYFNSLSEAKLSWKPFDWLVAKASIGEIVSHELVGTDMGKNADGVRLIGTARTLNFIPMGSLELGLVLPIFGRDFEFAGGVGSDGTGLLYPRASLFTSIRLLNNLSMMLGIEAITYTHDIGTSVSAKQQVFTGENAAVLDHWSSERSGFIGPSIEFSWRP